jgi:hypothetical protein
MPEAPIPVPPPLHAVTLIELVPKDDPTDDGLKRIERMGVLSVGLVVVATLLAALTVICRRWGELWSAVADFVVSVARDLIRHGWDGVIMGLFLTGMLVVLVTLVAFIVVMAMRFRTAGHRRIEKLDRDMAIEDDRAAKLAGHPPERLAAKSRRLKLEIQFYERSATKFILATGVSAAIPLLTPVFPLEWKAMIDNFRYLPSALALGLGLAAFVLHHRAEILMRAEFLVSEARELALARAASGDARPAQG